MIWEERDGERMNEPVGDKQSEVGVSERAET